MNIKVAFPKNFLTNHILSGYIEAKDKYSLDYKEFNDKQTDDLFVNNLVDIALISPMAYANGYNKGDFRIIPESTIATIGYSGFGSIFFKKGLGTISRIGSREPNNFMSIMAKLILEEKYEIISQLDKSHYELSKAISDFDAIVSDAHYHSTDPALDISEEWFMSYEMPLVWYLWAIRADRDIEDAANIVRLISGNSGIDEISIVEDFSFDGESEKRQGSLMLKWNSEVENSLGQLIQFLYFKQVVPEIAAVKILGRVSKD